MTKYFRYLSLGLLLPLLCAVSCGSEEIGEESSGYTMSMTLTARGDQSQPDMERQIHSLYIYAFDDGYLSSPDTYFEKNINKGQGAAQEYSIRMDIRRKGFKRFYVFANPPQYILSELKHKVTEEFLKSLSLYMYRPAFTVGEIPQSVNGLPDPTGKGGHFPMSNAFEAYVAQIDDSRFVYLTPDDNRDMNAIGYIPLFRSLGKISVEAYLKGYMAGNGVSVDRLEIYNYGGEGYALPFWSEESKYWLIDGPTAEWNPMKVMDLRKMAERETKVLTTPYPLLKAPVKLTQPAGDVAVVHPVTSFYLCQNSYGKRATMEDTQSGLEDAVGNRESRMVVYLSDGRVSELVLPFLRRNDNLKVRLAISEFGLNVDFKVWNTSNVNPDWGEEILPSVNE